jgi:hypothetical protein
MDLFQTSFLTYSPINREFYLAKGTEKFILGKYLLLGILLILPSLRPWGLPLAPPNDPDDDDDDPEEQEENS